MKIIRQTRQMTRKVQPPSHKATACQGGQKSEVTGQFFFLALFGVFGGSSKS
jgi:hypothetical protein